MSTTIIGKELRLSDFISSKDHRTLLFDTTIASSIGAPPELEDLSQILSQINEFFDGIIVNPGQAEHLAEHLGGKNRAAPLIRVDWTNAYRDEDFCLPAAKVKRVEVSDGQDALNLGASAVVATLFLGYDEDFESENIKSISLLCRECYELSLPVVVDIRPIGEKVSSANLSGSVKLGISFMMEAGADALIIPEVDTETYKVIGDWATVPVIICQDEIPSESKLSEIFEAKLSGILLSEKALLEENFLNRIEELYSLIHSRS